MFIRSVKITDLSQCEEYVWNLSAVRQIYQMGELPLDRSVTLLSGENGSGKSTLLEAIAVKYGFNAEGGSLNFSFSTEETHSSLHNYVKLIREAERPKSSFFLRAETFYNAASYIGGMDKEVLKAYGGISLHEQSHGESFFSLFMNRFIGHGFYILDEPEAALSPSRQMSLMIRMHELAEKGCQFIIATHSPILLAYPDALVYELSDDGITEISYEMTECFQVFKSFMQNPERMLKHLLGE